jgi:hypothetical protein
LRALLAARTNLVDQHLVNHFLRKWNAFCLNGVRCRNGAAWGGELMKIYLALLLFGTLLTAIRARTTPERQ